MKNKLGFIITAFLLMAGIAFAQTVNVQKSAATGNLTAGFNIGTQTVNLEKVQSSSFTAVAGDSYVITASATVTDPASPVNGQSYRVRVSAGTATVGGVAYSVAGSVITRSYNGTVWANSVSAALDTSGNPVVEDVDAFLGEIEVSKNLPQLGYIFNQASWSDFSGYVTQGTTPTISSGRLVFSGASGGFGSTFARDYLTMLPSWETTISIIAGTVDGTSYGLGVGIRGAHANTGGKYSLIGRVVLSTGGGGVILNWGNTGEVLATSSSSLSWSEGDVIRLTAGRRGDVGYVRASNLTTQSLEVYAEYRFAFSYYQDRYTTNTGYPSIYNFGGTHEVQSWSFYSECPKNCDLAIIGDSKSSGYYSGTFGDMWSERLGRKYKSVNLASGYENTVLVLARMPEIIALAPKNVVLCIGRNDLMDGASVATTAARYDSIVSQLEAAGITVWHLLPIYETAIDQSGLRTHIETTYAAGRLIDDGLDAYAGSASNVLVADNVHPNAFGNEILYRAVDAAISGDVPRLPLIIQTAFRSGTATLVAGTVTVADTSITANTHIFVNRMTAGGTRSAGYDVTRTASTSFTITGYDGAGAAQTADTSLVAYLIFEP